MTCRVHFYSLRLQGVETFSRCSRGGREGLFSDFSGVLRVFAVIGHAKSEWDTLRRVRIPIVILLAMITWIPSQGLEAAPFIRVVKDGGIWWFEDARGQRFFSLGENCTVGCFGHAEESPMEGSRKQRIVTRLVDHGFNTTAAWSSPSIWDRFYVADQNHPRTCPGR